MGEVNGVGPLSGWVIFLLGARNLLGRRSLDDKRLEPVYEVGCRIMQQGPAYVALPILFLASLRSIELPAGAAIVPVESLSLAERKMLARVVAQAEETVGKLRAAESGILVPGAR